MRILFPNGGRALQLGSGWWRCAGAAILLLRRVAPALRLDRFHILRHCASFVMLLSDCTTETWTRSWLASACIGAMLLFASGLDAAAQTPAATFENENGDTRLQLNSDGALVVPGIFGPASPADAIPATGEGSRMMWYPAKGAFRAGRILHNTEGWDAANVGNYSVAFGLDTEASAVGAMAFGEGAEASGEHAVSLGHQTEAAGFRSTAIGGTTRAYGTLSTAIGFATEATGQAATAMGQGTHATGRAATAMGEGVTANSDHSLSIGKYNSSNTANSGDSNILFVAGNGAENARSDALVLDKDGNLEIAGTLTESSDERLKTGIDPMGSVLDGLEEVTPVRYRFKEGTGHPSDEQIGLLAQEVREQFPELVEEGSSGYLSLAYPKFSTVLLKGVQEQQATIDSLSNRVEHLEEVHEKQEDLARQVATLQAEMSSDTAVSAGVPGSLLLGGGLAILLVGAGIGAAFRRRVR